MGVLLIRESYYSGSTFGVPIFVNLFWTLGRRLQAGVKGLRVKGSRRFRVWGLKAFGLHMHQV